MQDNSLQPKYDTDLQRKHEDREKAPLCKDLDICHPSYWNSQAMVPGQVLELEFRPASLKNLEEFRSTSGIRLESISEQQIPVMQASNASLLSVVKALAIVEPMVGVSEQQPEFVSYLSDIALSRAHDDRHQELFKKRIQLTR